MSSLNASVAAASLDLSIPWTALRRVYAGANGESNKKLYFQEVARRKGRRGEHVATLEMIVTNCNHKS
jgi:hypothetical protein